MSQPSGMDLLFGEWEATGQMDLDGQTIEVTGHTTIEPLGEFVVLRSTVQPAEFPDSISIIGGGPEGEPAPMHYFDERGVQRLYLSTVGDGRWVIWRGDESWRESPGHNQRYVGETSPDGSKITGAWERGLGEAGDQWELDFTLDYERVR
jgi:hypothetical protein